LPILVFLYRRTAGRFGGTIQGLPVLLLTTTGRRTGKRRTTPLGFFEHSGGFVIIGSNAGFDTHPGWFHNLRHTPRASIEIKDRQFDVNSEILGPDVRPELWAKLVALAPGYAEYAKKTRREIPMVMLRPAKA
jgi:deazaflavin-dependent oxidoreductase (nitroreductase family)